MKVVRATSEKWNKNKYFVCDQWISEQEEALIELSKFPLNYDSLFLDNISELEAESHRIVYLCHLPL